MQRLQGRVTVQRDTEKVRGVPSRVRQLPVRRRGRVKNNLLRMQLRVRAGLHDDLQEMFNGDFELRRVLRRRVLVKHYLLSRAGVHRLPY